MAWYFHYIPVGMDAEPKLMLNPAQRETMIRRIRYLRSEKGNHPIALTTKIGVDATKSFKSLNKFERVSHSS